MIIQQFYDKSLAHASYAVISQSKMAVIDPTRDPRQYFKFADEHGAELIAVIETHPHADFISSHLEISKMSSAVIYVSKLVNATYPHQTFDDGDALELGDIILRAINTPGHSPDSICIIVEDDMGLQKAVFTGDTLFVGDVGRPDLRENAGDITTKKEELARQMYRSTREKLMTLPSGVIVYPAHGPGSLCGKNINADLQSTIGRELRENYALQLTDQLMFVKMLTNDQPFIPRYFNFDVDLNKQGAPNLEQSIKAIPQVRADDIIEGMLVIDTRHQQQFKLGHIRKAINIQNGDKFETWLGSIINPDEFFYLVAQDNILLDIMSRKAAKIGYEQNIKGLLLNPVSNLQSSFLLDLNYFKRYPNNYTIIDIRNPDEVKDKLIFEHAINIPLPGLKERFAEIPTDKPIVVHCAGGYRSAIGSSILAAQIDAVPVYDLGEAIGLFIL